DTTAPAKPVINTPLVDKAGTKTPVEVSAEPGSTVALYDKDGNATDPSGNTSDVSEPKVATDTTAPAKPEVKTDLTGKAGTKDPVEVSAEPGSTVALYDKDGNKIGEAKADENGVATITPTKDIPVGNVTATATDPSGNTSDVSEPKVATDTKDGNKIGEATADENGKATITPTVDIPAGNVTAKATKDGQTSDASAPKEATAATPAKPSQPVVDTDLTGKAGTKDPVEVTAAPGTKVELFDKDGNKIGEATADENGKATIT
ncbi:Ig-like domain-containing protein, partial [Streptococcus salivarius]|uniref:Ig-like domain-containing protein n=1 Tax=Streptococcus salivarius TaxID=1304 RepID=UPI0022E4FA9A